MNKNTYFHKKIEIPVEIKKLQEWFACIISRPLNESNCVEAVSMSDSTITKEASYFISSNHTLEPHQRIEIYHKQYWWRLINAMQKFFPLTLQFLGYKKFENVTVQYLLKYPPDNWSLTVLGRNFPLWIKENYRLPDVRLIFHAAEIDLYFYLSSIASNFLSISKEAVTEKNFLSKTIKLQPHIFLLKSFYNLLGEREVIIKNGVEISNDYLKKCLKDNSYFIIFRNKKNNICWKGINKEEYFLLKLFKEGTSLLKSCDWIKMQNSFSQEIMTKNFHIWIQSWIQLNWLTLSSELFSKK